MFEALARDGGNVDEFIGSVASSLTRTDEGHLMLAARGNLLSYGFEHDFCTPTEAMKAGKGE